MKLRLISVLLEYLPLYLNTVLYYVLVCMEWGEHKYFRRTLNDAGTFHFSLLFLYRIAFAVEVWFVYRKRRKRRTGFTWTLKISINLNAILKWK